MEHKMVAGLTSGRRLRPRWLIPLAALGLAAILAVGPNAAQAATYSWTLSPVAGDWLSAGNWNDGGTTLPTNSDSAYVDNGGTAAVNSSAAACDILYVGAAENGTLQINGGSLATTTYEIIAESSGTGNITQSGGTNTAGTLILTYNSSGSGTYLLNGTGSLRVTSEEDVGFYGTGNFTQSGGASAVSGNLYVGRYQGGNGSYDQSAGTNAVTGSLILGKNSGSSGAYSLTGGTLSVSQIAQGTGQAAFDFGGGVLQANAPFSTALPMTLTGTGGNATLDTNGCAVGLSGGLSGAGGLIVQGGGSLTLSGSNIYNGGTSVDDGLLVIDSSEAIPKGSTVATGPGGSIVLGDPALPSIGSAVGGLSPVPSTGLAPSDFHTVPEPGTVMLLAAGALALAAWMGRNRARAAARPA
jgi:autotransporter-associated beta strand protein